MREVVLLVPRLSVEDVLDRLLPIVPGGVREVPVGGQVELRMRGEDVPALSVLARAAGRWPYKLAEHEVSDDWRQRRVADYRADVIGDRLVVRPEWAPPPRAGLIEIVLGESSAFGGGTHPTTHTLLELLLELTPRGSFADLGCGTGVLAIVAARLGWGPVSAVDVQPGSVESARENARRNDVEIDAQVMDLSVQPPPTVDGFAANVPAELHAIVAAGLGEPVPRVGLISGFGTDEAAAVVEGYAALGLAERRRVDAHGWVIVVLKRD